MKIALLKNALNIAANISFIFGVLMFNLFVAVAGSGIRFLLNPDPAQAAYGPSLLIPGIILGLHSVLAFLFGIFTRLAVLRPDKVMPIRYLCAIAFVYKGAYIAYRLAVHTPFPDLLTDLVFFISTALLYFSVTFLCNYTCYTVPIENKTQQPAGHALLKGQ